MHSTLLSKERKLSKWLIGFNGRPSWYEALLWMLGWRTGSSSPRQKISKYREQNISGTLFPAPGTPAQMEPMLAFNLIFNLSRTAPVQAGATEPWSEPGPGRYQFLPADSRAGREHLLLHFLSHSCLWWWLVPSNLLICAHLFLLIHPGHRVYHNCHCCLQNSALECLGTEWSISIVAEENTPRYQ